MKGKGKHTENELRLIHEIADRYNLPEPNKTLIRNYCDGDEKLLDMEGGLRWLFTKAPTTVRRLMVNIAEERQAIDYERQACLNLNFADRYELPVKGTFVIIKTEFFNTQLTKLRSLGVISKENQLVISRSCHNKKLITGFFLQCIEHGIIYIIGPPELMKNKKKCEILLSRWFCEKFSLKDMQERFRCRDACIKIIKEIIPVFKEMESRNK